MKILSLFPFLLLSASAASLTLDEALARAAAQHPRLLAQDAREEVASALAEQAAYRPNPEMKVSLENFAGTGRARGLDALETTVELSQTIERGDKRARRVALAGQGRDLAAAEAELIRAGILGATAKAYVAVAAAAQRVTLAEDLVALARTALAEAEKRHAAGDAPVTEPVRARVGLAGAQAEAQRQAVALLTARAALAALWGGEPADVTAGSTTFHFPETAPDPAAWLSRLDAHPRLKLEQARVEAARARAGLEQANAAQDISVSGGVRYLRENSDAALVASVSVPLSVRHRNQGAIRAARQELAGAEFEAAAIVRELRMEVLALGQEVAAAHAAALRLRREVLPAAEEAVALLHRAYAAGQAAQLEVLDTERTLQALQRELLDQEAAYAAAVVRAEALLDPTFTLTRQLLPTP